MSARPVQAALASRPVRSQWALLVIALVPASVLVWVVAGSVLVFLALLGSLATRAGGASGRQRHHARYLLGRPGNGADGRSWGAVRGGCLIRVQYDGFFQARPFAGSLILWETMLHKKNKPGGSRNNPAANGLFGP
ncbi:hypothetical protein [Immundisolibacter sp.]